MEIQIEFFSRQIKNMREAKSLTQEELAHVLGVSRQSIISLERGKCLPSLPLAISLADAFDLTLEHFIQPEAENKINEPRKEVRIMSQDLTPFSPMSDLVSLHESLDKLFEESSSLPKNNLVLPVINVYEKDNQIILEAEVPGIKEEDLSIEVSEDHLVISGEKKMENEVQEKDYYRIETSFGTFSRTISLPAEIDQEKTEAELKNGILRIVLPKVALVQPKMTKIQVKKS